MSGNVRRVCSWDALLVAVFVLWLIYLNKDCQDAWVSEPTNEDARRSDHAIKRDGKITLEQPPESSHDRGFLQEIKPDCRHGPKRNIVFLKTHKTGSSTMQNILMRYAIKNKLFIGLPSKPLHFKYETGLGFKRTFMKTVPPNQDVNMLLHHMVFNHEEVRRTVPLDAVYFTILRDPATQFESIFNYFRRITRAFRRIKSNNAFEDYLIDPNRFFKGRHDGNHWWFAKNNLFFDLGFDNFNGTDEYIKSSVNNIERMFKFVAISEYFDISLILLKNLLCWDMDDVLYLSLNARNQSSVTPLNTDLAKKIYEWNKADAMLYQHFNKTFWRRVKAYGIKRMEKDLKELHRKKAKLQNFCVEKDMLKSSKIRNKMFKMYSPPGLEVTQYQIRKEAKNNETCIQLILPELQWYHKLNCRQYAQCLNS